MTKFLYFIFRIYWIINSEAFLSISKQFLLLIKKLTKITWMRKHLLENWFTIYLLLRKYFKVKNSDIKILFRKCFSFANLNNKGRIISWLFTQDYIDFTNYLFINFIHLYRFLFQFITLFYNANEVILMPRFGRQKEFTSLKI